MMNAFNTSNTEAVKKCLAEILELDENLIFKYRALIAVATFDGNLDQLSENTRKNIVKNSTILTTGWRISIHYVC